MIRSSRLETETTPDHTDVDRGMSGEDEKRQWQKLQLIMYSNGSTFYY